jgi:D-alanine-D-alanine ligase
MPIFVTRDGEWRMLPEATELSAAATVKGAPQLCLLPGGHGRLLAIPEDRRFV